jgi:hypothetical protein
LFRIVRVKKAVFETDRDVDRVCHFKHTVCPLGTNCRVGAGRPHPVERLIAQHGVGMDNGVENGGAHTLSQLDHKGKYRMRDTDSPHSEALAVAMLAQRGELFADEQPLHTMAPVRDQHGAGACIGVGALA